MPIKPENRGLYPDDWKDIRAKILERANHRCECRGECGLDHKCVAEHRALGYWDITNNATFRNCPEKVSRNLRDSGVKVIKIVLTIAHLDHDPKNNDFENLRAFCQRCHNRYDIPHRRKNASATRDKKRGQKHLDF